MKILIQFVVEKKQKKSVQFSLIRPDGLRFFINFPWNKIDATKNNSYKSVTDVG